MNKGLRLLGTIFFAIVISLTISSLARAAVYGDDNVINGLFTQEAINQTNKSQYADRSGNENIDEVTGALTWKSNQIHLPGVEGLDLDIGVMYKSNYSFFATMSYNYSGSLKKYNYLISRYDLGLGWSFRFPSVQLADGYTYYHTGEGPIYRVDFAASGAADSYTHLIGYQGKDVQFNSDPQGIFHNGQASSAYYLEYASKKREYFAADGRLLGIVDRYGNSLTFQHEDRVTYDGQTNKVISSITDSIGRTITFSYTTNLQTATDEEFNNMNGEKIIITVKDSSGNFVESITYTKWRVKTNWNGVPDGYVPYLWSIQNQKSEYTNKFYYETKHGRFDHRYKSYEYSGNNSYLMLNRINGIRSESKYQYELIDRNLGPYGILQEYRVSQRFEQLVKSTEVAGGNQHINYSYINDYTGYPKHWNPYDLPEDYSFSSQSVLQSNTRTSGLTSMSTFNGKQQSTAKETRTASGERKATYYLAYHAIFTQLPTNIQLSDYGTGDSDATANKLFVDKTYTDWGAVQTETKPLTESQRNDPNIKSKYTTTLTYEPNFHQIESRKMYQNDATLLSEFYTYDANGRLRTYQNPKGEVTTTWYETIDTNGNVMNNADQPALALTGKVRKNTTSKPIEGGKTSQTVTQYYSDTQYAYPGEVTTTLTTTDSNGQPVTLTVRKSMSYHMGTGLLKEEADGSLNKTSYVYDELGRVLRIIYPDFLSLAGERYAVSDEFQYNQVYDNTPFAEDPENSGLYELSVYSYRKYTKLSTNSVTTLNHQYDYFDGMGNVRRVFQYDPQSNSWKDARNHYDDQGRITYSRDLMGNVSTASYDGWGNQDEVFDSFGNLYKMEKKLKERRNIHYFVAAAQVEAYRTNPLRADLKSQYVEQEVDQWGRLLTVRTYKDWPATAQPMTEEYQYDMAGNLKAYVDPNKNRNGEGATKTYQYDALNRLVKIKDAVGQLTNIEYNAIGKASRIYLQSSDGGAAVQLNSKLYNEIGGIASKADAAGAIETYAYNGLGQLTRAVDRKGAITTAQYDAQGRTTISSIHYNGVSQEIKTNIGSGGILVDTIQTFLNGSSTATMTTQMDTKKRITSVNQTAASYSSSLALTYNANNQMTRQYSSITGVGVNYQYDRNRLDKVQMNGQSTLDTSDASNVKYGYYPNGQLDTVSYPPLSDGTIISSKYTYDALGRLKTLINTKGGTVLSSYSYEYDNNGNITVVTEATPLGSKSSTYTYDKLNRLETITRSDGTNVRYTYDLRGNRVTQQDTRPQFLSLDDTTNSYDLYNRLTGVTKGGTTTSFSYSADGLRYKKENTSQTTQYHYNATGQVIAESNAGNSIQANYIRGDRLLVKKEKASGKSYYYLYNGHGDVVMMVDTNGAIVNQYQYDEWGKLLVNQETVVNSFKYAGEVYDEETGLYYLRARYYDPSIGRFINEDTYEGEITNPLSLNLYTYVHNNPLIYSDPTGNWCTSSDGKYSHPGGCDGGTDIDGVKSNLNGSVWTPDADHVGQKVKWEGSYKGSTLLEDDLDMTDMSTKTKNLLAEIEATQQQIDDAYNQIPTELQIQALQTLLSMGVIPRNADAYAMLYGDIKNVDKSGWNKGSYDTVEDSIIDHYRRHPEVNASSPSQYLRKAEGFKQNLKGTTKSDVYGPVEDVVRYKKNGKYIDLAPDGTIISFGGTK